MTELVEDITIKITLNHCLGDSVVLGARRDLRAEAVAFLRAMLPEWLSDRTMTYLMVAEGITIQFENTGLYEAPEVGGGDN